MQLSSSHIQKVRQILHAMTHYSCFQTARHQLVSEQRISVTTLCMLLMTIQSGIKLIANNCNTSDNTSDIELTN